MHTAFLINIHNALIKAPTCLLNICVEAFDLAKWTCLVGHSFPQLLFYCFILFYSMYFSYFIYLILIF